MATVVPGPAPSARGGQRDAIPGYRIIRELGRGGMGVVYEAHEEATGRNVALKLLAEGVDHTEEAAQRFLREGKIAASLSHPRSTFVYDAGEIDNRFYITMELMSGGTVKDVIDREGKLPVTEAVNYTLDMLDGLEAAHAKGVVHRDVKPSNAFVTADGRVKVGDFGISKSLVSDASLTMTGAFMGTPQFAAPEQIRAAEIDHRTDLYSVGATLFYMLAGRAPFQGDAIQVVADIVSEKPPTLQSVEPDAPVELSQLLARVMEKDPNNRPQSAGELKMALLPFSDRKSSIGDVGLRMAAFFVDTTICSFAISALIVLLLTGLNRTGDFTSASGQTVVVTASFLLLVLYFAICESRWGRGIGKRMMSLRVINERGQTPGFGKTLLRALLVPGVATAVRTYVPLWFSYYRDVDPIELRTGGATEVDALFLSVGVPVLAVAAGLIFLSTMRRTNGYRGLHELLTGTRVVRVHSKTVTRTAPPVTVPVADKVDAGEQYEVAGRLCQLDDYAVYAATDKTLARPVWLLRSGSEASPFTQERMNIARGTRQHILRHHIDGQDRWDAIEAVAGVPLASINFNDGAYSWSAIREALIDLAEELQLASAEDTLPKSLTLDQVWLDAGGRLKLLDQPVRPAQRPGIEQEEPKQSDAESENAQNSPSAVPTNPYEVSPPLYDTGDPFRTPTQLMRDVLRACRPLLPGSGLDLAKELETRADNDDTLKWVVTELRHMGHRPGAMSWDERLGALAISFGLEATFVQTLSLVAAVVVRATTGKLWMLLVLALALPMIVGFLFRGGPVFRLAGVKVRSKGEPAGPVRCAFRNFIAWAPLTTASALLMWIAAEIIHPPGPQVTGMERGIYFMVLVLGLGVFVVGAFFTVLSPKRGLHDFLTGTELVVE